MGLRARDGSGRGCHGEKEKGGSGYNTPYPTQGYHHHHHPPHQPVANVRGKERERRTKGERMDEAQRAKARREEKSFTVYDTQLVSSGIPQFREPILRDSPSPPPYPQIYRTSLLFVSLSLSSILPAARYRLPNNLTDCSAHRLPERGIRVLVSFQNLSEYPAILTPVKRREGEKREDLSRIACI